MTFFTAVWSRGNGFYSQYSLFASSIRLLSIAVLCGGFVRPVLAQPTQVQLVHAAEALSSSVLDVYVDGVLKVDDLAFTKASTYITIPVSSKSTVAVRDGQSSATAAPLASFDVSFKARKRQILALCSPATGMVPVDMVLDTLVYTASQDTSRSSVKFVQLGARIPAFDMLLRTGSMLLGGVEYGQVTNYLALPPVDNYLDVKASGTSNIFSTYRLSLQPYKARTLWIFSIGDVARAENLKFYAVDDLGSVFSVEYAPVARVQYINTAPASFDVYKNGTRFVNDAAQGGAMPYKYLPSGIDFRIAVSPSTSMTVSNPAPLDVFSYLFKDLGTYLAISTGQPGNAQFPLDMRFYEHAQEKATEADKVDLVFFHGAYGTGPLSLHLGGPDQAMPSVSYTGFSNYISLSAGVIPLEVLDGQTGALRFSCPLDLSAYQGQAVVLFTMTAPDNLGGIDLLMALSTGATVPVCRLSALTGTASDTYLRCWPNPASDQLSIAFGAGQPRQRVFCRVFDSEGRDVAVYSVALGTDGAGTTSIDLANLGAGFYWAELATEEGRVLARQKFVKQTTR